MQEVGRVLRREGISEICLVHGTFVGPDALGILSDLAHWCPKTKELLGRFNKALVDRVTGDAGNYTARYARTLEQAIHETGRPRIAVRRFNWSSQNNHIGRADGAVRLIGRLASRGESGRTLLWGHSHAGNLFAIMTNLLAADPDSLEDFFGAAKIYYRWPVLQLLDVPVWERVRSLLLERDEPHALQPLDIVTFGTPIRYGWDSNGYSRLLHFINHHPTEGKANYLADFPPTMHGVLEAANGDYIQQFGIAGTNLLPSIFSCRSWLADRRLSELLQPGLRRRDLLERLRAGRRVPEEGTTLLVDYGPSKGAINEHIAGHAVYTRENWILFHAEEVIKHFYAPQPSTVPPSRDDCRSEGDRRPDR